MGMVFHFLDYFTRTFSAVLSSERKNVTAVTAPVGTHIRKSLETMRDTMVQLLLVGIRFRV